ILISLRYSVLLSLVEPVSGDKQEDIEILMAQSAEYLSGNLDIISLSFLLVMVWAGLENLRKSDGGGNRALNYAFKVYKQSILSIALLLFTISIGRAFPTTTTLVLASVVIAVGSVIYAIYKAKQDKRTDRETDD
ncbi:MAG: hypothetical protein AAF889_14980, partial [Cyanobacteria bacterium P01_D01_bin.73]